ncbi:MAG: hypothetical protein N2513_08470 [Deltaproteobacteria bacterium]|nr:hypothetical protein [Deltaproteobacteria bacterium]
MRKSLVLVPFILCIVVSGCAYLEKTRLRDTQKEAKEGPGLNQVFYNFPDIPIPKELELISDKTFIYESPALRAGVLVLRGNVDVESLQNYFKVNMSKNGWRFINSFRFKDITMNYAKDDRTCTIKISREGFSTDVEISVGPHAGFPILQKTPEK